MIVPLTAGSGADIAGRIVAKSLSETWKQSVIIENRPGAGGLIGTGAVVSAEADGYTLLVQSASYAANPAIYKKLPYDPLKSLVDVDILGQTPYVLITSADGPYQSVRDLIIAAKSKPGEITFASAGVGSSTHLAAEYFNQMMGIKLIHVPYKGSAPGMADLLAGNITMTFDSGLSSIPNIQAKKIRPIAVASTKRLANLPDVPTFAELGIANFNAGSWYGFFAPAGTPREIVNLLNKNIHQIVAMPEISARIQSLGATVQVNTPEEYSAQIAKETEQWAMVIQKAKIQLE
jgi:tripartite-type tricarboxylate transporter receptor subunit TctC